MNVKVCLRKLYETDMGCKLYYDIVNENDVNPIAAQNGKIKKKKRLMQRITGKNVIVNEMHVN